MGRTYFYTSADRIDQRLQRIILDDVNAFRLGPSTDFREQLGRLNSMRPNTEGGVTDKAHEDANKLLAAHLGFFPVPSACL